MAPMLETGVAKYGASVPEDLAVRTLPSVVGSGASIPVATRSIGKAHDHLSRLPATVDALHLGAGDLAADAAPGLAGAFHGFLPLALASESMVSKSACASAWSGS